MKYYEVWSPDTGNLALWAASQEEILAHVRGMVTIHGPEVAKRWGLAWGDDENDDAGGLIAEGQALVELAERQSSAA